MKKKPNIFFILADARSGTTFLANNIIKKLGILVIPETNFVLRLLKANQNTFSSKKILINYLFKEKKFRDLKITKKELLSNLSNINSIREIILDILKIYYIKNNGKYNYVGIKKGYLYFLDQIMDLFPNAKIFNIIRDCRAVYNSKKNSIYSKIGKPFSINPYETAKVWNEKIDIIIKSKKKYKAVIFFYEDIIKNLDPIIFKISKNLKLPNKKFLKIKQGYYVSNIYHKKLHSNINLPPNLENIEKWKKSLLPYEIFCLELISKKNLNKFKYSLINERRKIINYLYVYNFFLKYTLVQLKPFKLIKSIFV